MAKLTESERDYVSEQALQAARNVVAKAFDNHRVTPDLIAQTVFNALHARIIKPHYDKDLVIERTEKGEKVKRTGGFVYSKPMVDHTTRLRAAEFAHEVIVNPTKKVELTGKDGNPIETTVTNFPPAPKNLDEWQRQMEEAEKARMDRQQGGKE